LTIGHWSIPGTGVGPIDPLPPLDGLSELHTVTLTDDDIPEEMARNVHYGRVSGILPYLLQDGYSRDHETMSLVTAVLENDILRATFLLEYGGRLWSLVHKPTGRELLYVNPVLQPVNFALRNAWFSGGVEWNIGTIGHAPLGFEPIHAVRVDGPDGQPILRMYDWERIRATPFQIDVHLPDGSEMLFVHVRIRNPHDHDVPIYWWSNIAVPEREDVRVVTPADAAYRFSYDMSLTRVPIPVPVDVDVSYATNGVTSNDYFFDVAKDRQPWITALDGAGTGLVQVSTPLLRGRKLFIWGMARPGRRWQEFLSMDGHPYLEIQAGIAQTQFEHVPLPAASEFSWVEGYGLLEADPAMVHGAWSDARAAVETRLATLAPPAALDAEHAILRSLADTPPAEVLFRGSGWGALDRRRRLALGEPDAGSPGMPFPDDSLGEDQAPWVALLDHGVMPTHDPASPPPSYVIDAGWDRLLAASHESWLTHLHRGVIHHHAGDRDRARAAWERSLTLMRNPWTLRDLAVLDRQDGDLERAADRLREASGLAPGVRPLAMEVIRTLIEGGRATDALTFIDTLDPVVRAHGRVQVLETQAALDAGDLDRAGAILDAGIVLPDLREGGVILENLWYAYQELRSAARSGRPVDDEIRARARAEHPVPRIYDFRKPQ
jgi:hypothetical protein